MKSGFCCIIFMSLLFIILSLPQTYKLTNHILPTYNKSPTLIGIVVHSVVFAIIIIIAKNIKNKESFIVCNKGDFVMNSDINKKYLDLSDIKSPLSEMGTRGTKWPYNKRYIPQTDSKWCLKKRKII